MRRWISMPGEGAEAETIGGVEHWLFALYDVLTPEQQTTIRDQVRKMVESEGGAVPDAVEGRRKIQAAAEIL